MCKEKLPKILYHYCSLDTFTKIIETKTLRFTDITKSNDSDEIRFLWRKYNEYSQQTCSKTEHLLLEIMKNHEIERKKHFAFCLTELSDELYFWNSYAKGGIAIGFSYKKLDKWVKTNIKWYVDKKPWKDINAFPCKLYPVTYYNGEKFCCKKLYYIFDDICKKDYPFALIPTLTPFTKNSFFTIEQEWRIAFTIEITKIVEKHKKEMCRLWCSCGKKGAVISPKISTVNGKERLFFEIPYKSDFIEKVVLCNNNPLSEDEICYFLNMNGINISRENILRSKGTLI